MDNVFQKKANFKIGLVLNFLLLIKCVYPYTSLVYVSAISMYVSIAGIILLVAMTVFMFIKQEQGALGVILFILLNIPDHIYYFIDLFQYLSSSNIWYTAWILLELLSLVICIALIVTAALLYKKQFKELQLVVSALLAVYAIVTLIPNVYKARLQFLEVSVFYFFEVLFLLLNIVCCVIAIVQVQHSFQFKTQGMPLLSSQSAIVAAPQGSAADELLRYKELFDTGVITADDFEAKKAELLK